MSKPRVLLRGSGGCTRGNKLIGLVGGMYMQRVGRSRAGLATLADTKLLVFLIPDCGHKNI